MPDATETAARILRPVECARCSWAIVAQSNCASPCSRRENSRTRIRSAGTAPAKVRTSSRSTTARQPTGGRQARAGRTGRGRHFIERFAQVSGFAEDRAGTDVHDACYPVAQRGFDHFHGTQQVDHEYFARHPVLASEVCSDRRAMDHAIYRVRFHCRIEIGTDADVADRDRHVARLLPKRGQRVGGRRKRTEQNDAVASIAQLLGDVEADEPGATGDQYRHARPVRPELTRQVRVAEAGNSPTSATQCSYDCSAPTNPPRQRLRASRSNPSLPISV